MHGTRGEILRFACVINLQVEGKETPVLCEKKTLQIQELKQRAAKYCRWELMFVLWTVFACLSATPPIPVIPLPFTVTDVERTDSPRLSAVAEFGSNNAYVTYCI
jgi:hypothetical protein